MKTHLDDKEFKELVEAFWEENSILEMSTPGWYLKLSDWAKYQFMRAAYKLQYESESQTEETYQKPSRDNW